MQMMNITYCASLSNTILNTRIEKLVLCFNYLIECGIHFTPVILPHLKTLIIDSPFAHFEHISLCLIRFMCAMITR